MQAQQKQIPLQYFYSAVVLLTFFRVLIFLKTGPILENTTSTTTCVMCARVRTRRKAFAPPASGWAAPPPGQLPTTVTQAAGNQAQFQQMQQLASSHDSRDSGEIFVYKQVFFFWNYVLGL